MTDGHHPRYVCPVCRSSVEERAGGYRCRPCDRVYPILFGIPDFRLSGDLYLSLEDERAKAKRLHAYAESHDLRELVAYYYSITDDVPARLAPLFTEYVLNAPQRSVPAVRALSRGRHGGALLDLGCGSGGALVAAAGDDLFQHRTGVDIALRWLVIARKRLDEAGVQATLVCADAEALPFPDSSFTHVLAADLLENTKSPAAAVRSAAAVLEDGGFMYLSSSNRRWIGPHPATGVWAAGWLPRPLRAALMRRRHGVDILRAVSFVSPGSVRRMAKAAGLRQLCARPLGIDVGRFDHRSRLFRMLARSYARLAKARVFGSVLLAAGPVFQSLFVKETLK